MTHYTQHMRLSILQQYTRLQYDTILRGATHAQVFVNIAAMAYALNKPQVTSWPNLDGLDVAINARAISDLSRVLLGDGTWLGAHKYDLSGVYYIGSVPPKCSAIRDAG